MKIVTKMKRVRTSRSLACSRVKFSTVADEIERLERIKWRNIEPLVELSNRVKINDNYVASRKSQFPSTFGLPFYHGT